MTGFQPPFFKGADAPGDLRDAAVAIARRLAYSPLQMPFVCRKTTYNGYTATVVGRNGQFTVFVDAPDAPREEKQGTLFADYYGGIVATGNIRLPSQAAQEKAAEAGDLPPPSKLRHYIPDNLTATYYSPKMTRGQQLEFTPLAIRPKLAGLDDPPSPNPFPTTSASQYKRLRASTYTGEMRKVVQYLMGCPQALAWEDEPVTYEQGTELDSPAAIRFEYAWGKTHGIYTTPGKQRWVVEISAAGIRAWVLDRLDRATGADVLTLFGLPTEVDADELTRSIVNGLTPEQTAIYESMGYLPLAFGPPDLDTFYDMVDAGMAFECTPPAEIAPFYAQGEAYFPACGWAFNATGTDVVNTCFTVDPTTTFRKARYMRLGISGGEPAGAGHAPVTVAVEEFTEEWLLGAGAIYFPHPSATPGGLPSLRPLQTRPRSWPSPPPAQPPKVPTDTVVYAYFAGEAEVRVYASAPAQSAAPKATDTTTKTGFLRCSVGNQTTRTVREWTGSPGGVYTSHYDDRRLPEGAQTTTTSTKKFLGWTGQVFGQEPGIDCWGSATKVGVIDDTTQTVTADGRTFNQAVHIPLYDREAYFYSKQEVSHAKRTIKQRSGGTIGGGSSRRYYTYDPFWIRVDSSYLGGAVYTLLRAPGYRGQLLSPGPVDGNPAHIYKHYEGQGWIECDPPITPPDPCAGPLPSGPFSVEPTPRITPTYSNSGAATEEVVSMVLRRGTAAETKVFDKTHNVAPGDETLFAQITPYSAEEVDGTLSAYAVTDCFSPGMYLATPPGWAGPINTFRGYGDRQAYTTTPIGAPHGLPT